MLLIYITLGVMLVSMAKKKPRRRGAPIVVIKQQNSVGLATLATDTVVKVDGLVLQQDFDHYSTDVIATLRGMTANEGPIDYGIVQSQLTVAQIQEALDASPVSSLDVLAIERTRRKVRMLGVFERSSEEDQQTNNGRFKRAKLFLKIPVGLEMPAFWIRNRSGATLTTGGVANFQQKNYGRWR